MYKHKCSGEPVILSECRESQFSTVSEIMAGFQNKENREVVDDTDFSLEVVVMNWQPL